MRLLLVCEYQIFPATLIPSPGIMLSAFRLWGATTASRRARGHWIALLASRVLRLREECGLGTRRKPVDVLCFSFTCYFRKVHGVVCSFAKDQKVGLRPVYPKDRITPKLGAADLRVPHTARHGIWRPHLSPAPPTTNVPISIVVYASSKLNFKPWVLVLSGVRKAYMGLVG